MIQLHALGGAYRYSQATRMGARAGHQLGIHYIEIALYPLGTAAGIDRFYEHK
jgi:hypothetical protein